MCDIPINEIEFESLDFGDKIDFYKSDRKKRFINFLDNSLIPSVVRETLIDFFPRLENHFFDSDRTNFVNINQLVIEMLRICQYREYVYLFKPLKTKSRIKKIRDFVEASVSYQYCNGVGLRLTEIPLQELKLDYEIDLSKSIFDHTYIGYNIDDTSRGQRKNKTQAQAKAKAKTKG